MDTDKELEDSDFIIKWTRRIKQAWDDGEDQRDEANEDIRFCNVPGGMWEGWFNDRYGGDSDRVKVEFDITSEAVNSFLGEWKENRAGVYFSPDDSATTDDEADELTGVYRADFNDNGGRVAVDLAVEECVECGVGHFLLTTEFVNPEDPENDKQKICWDTLENSYSYVVWDPSGKKINKSDAMWGAVLTPYTEDGYKEAFPDAETTGSAFTPHSRRWLDWSDETFIVVVELYTIDQRAETVHVYENVEENRVAAYPEAEIEQIRDELRDDGWTFVRERKITKQVVEKTVFNNAEVLVETQRIPGKHIPIIPMFAYRKYIDGLERYYGFVRKRKDPNRVFNMSLSRMAESAGTSPEKIPIFTREQVAGEVSQSWADNTGTDAYKLINSLTDKDGNPIHAGPVGYTEPTPIDPNTLGSLEMTMTHVQSLNGGAPQDTIDPNTSGKAVNALIAHSNKKTKGVSENINLSIEWSGEVWLGIAEEVYADRIEKRTIAEDGKASTTTLNDSIFDTQTGEIVQAETFSGKRYKVSARIGPQYETQREATVETLERVMTMVGNDSKYFSALLAMWMKNISGTGLEELKEFNRKEMLKMGLMEPETDEEKQMMQILSQQIDPTTELTKAAADQQKAEALNLIESAKNKAADTDKKKAETAKIISEIGGERPLLRAVN